MDLSKLSTADKVIGGAAILFFISLFLPWYGIDTIAGDYNQNGWSYFLTGVIPFLLVLAMVGQIAVEKFSTIDLPKPPIPWSQIQLAAGVTAAVLVVLRLIITSDRLDIDLDRKYGLFIGLIAAIALAVGGYLKTQESEEVVAGPSTAPPTPF